MMVGQMRLAPSYAVVRALLSVGAVLCCVLPACSGETTDLRTCGSPSLLGSVAAPSAGLVPVESAGTPRLIETFGGEPSDSWQHMFLQESDGTLVPMQRLCDAPCEASVAAIGVDVPSQRVAIVGMSPDSGDALLVAVYSTDGTRTASFLLEPTPEETCCMQSPVIGFLDGDLLVAYTRIRYVDPDSESYAREAVARRLTVDGVEVGRSVLRSIEGDLEAVQVQTAVRSISSVGDGQWDALVVQLGDRGVVEAFAVVDGMPDAGSASVLEDGPYFLLDAKPTASGIGLLLCYRATINGVADSFARWSDGGVLQELETACDGAYDPVATDEGLHLVFLSDAGYGIRHVSPSGLIRDEPFTMNRAPRLRASGNDLLLEWMSRPDSLSHDIWSMRLCPPSS
jgi:hypothetical protein